MMKVDVYKKIEDIVKNRTFSFIMGSDIIENDEEIKMYKILKELIIAIDDIPYAMYFTESYDNAILDVINVRLDVYLEYFNDIAIALNMSNISVSEIKDDIENSIFNINSDNIFGVTHSDLTKCGNTKEYTNDKIVKSIILVIKFFKIPIIKILDSAE